jgi:hypothetical protein
VRFYSLNSLLGAHTTLLISTFDHYQMNTIISIVCENTTVTSIGMGQSSNQEGDRAWP